MLPVPLRSLFRSRWAALLWAAGICVSAASFAGGDGNVSVNAANSADNVTAQRQALDAEDVE